MSQPHTSGGRAAMLASCLGFSLMGLCTQLLPDDVGSHQKVFFRSAGGLLILFAVLPFLVRRLSPPRNLRGLALRGIYGTLALLCYFYAIDTVGLAKGTLYCYMYPMFAGLIAWVELKERPGWRQWAALAAATAGVALTLDFTGSRVAFTAGDAAGLASGVLSGAAVTSIRRLRQNEHSIWIVMALAIVSVAMSVPLMLPEWVTPRDGGEWALLAGIALFATIAQILMTYGYRFLTAVEGSILALGIVPLNGLLGMILLSEGVTLRFWLGAGLIIAANSAVIIAPGAPRPGTNHGKPHAMSSVEPEKPV